jgi:hypothetical protein
MGGRGCGETGRRKGLKSLELARTGSVPVVRTILNLAKTRYEDVAGPVAQWLEPAAHNGLVWGFESLRPHYQLATPHPAFR